MTRAAINPVKQALPVPTPCIGVCSTVLGDSVCRGCKRFSHEVVGWNSYSQAQKGLVDKRLQHFLAQVVRTYLEVVDSELLQRQITINKIPCAAHRQTYCRVHDLLRAGAGQIKTLEQFGMRARPNRQGWSATQFRDAIDADFFALSEAHYHRYFKQPNRMAEPV